MVLFKKISIIVIITIIILCIHKPILAQNIDTIYDIEAEVIHKQKNLQDTFLILSLYEYLNNSLAWQEDLSTYFEEMQNSDLKFYVTESTSNAPSTTSQYFIRMYNSRNFTGTGNLNYTSSITGTTYSLPAHTYNFTRFSVVTQYGALATTVSGITTDSLLLHDCLINYRTDLYYDFVNMVFNNDGNVDYTPILQDISDYLSDLTSDMSTMSSNISSLYSVASSIASSVSTIVNNTNVDYSQDIQNIYNNLTNIYNYTYNIEGDVSDIKDTLDNFSSDLSDIKDFIEDSTINGNSFVNSLPTNTLVPHTQAEDIMDDFISDLQDAFNTDNSQDITLNLPLLGTFTIDDDSSYNLLPQALIVLIKSIYWFFIVRSIISYILTLVHKLRNFDIVESNSDGSPSQELL